MKYLLTIVLPTLCLVAGTVKAQKNFTEQIAVPLTNPDQRGSLEIGVVNGSIEVKSYQGKEVIIRAQSREDSDHDRHNHQDREKDKGKNAGLKRIASNPIEIEVKEDDNEVSVESNSWKNPIDFFIQVPANFDLELSTVNSGDIYVEGVIGSIELNNVNGEVVARNIGGSAIIDTVNGKVEVTFSSITKDSPMAFSTLNGDVDITFPSTIKAIFKMKSDQGEIYSDFDMDLENSGPKVNRSNKGNFKVTIENWVFGKVNGGGPEILFNNMNGDIYIRKGK